MAPPTKPREAPRRPPNRLVASHRRRACIPANKEVVRIGPYKDYIASGVRVGDSITLSGQVAVNDQGQVVGPGDLEAQVRHAYGCVKEILGEFGATMNDIVDEMWLVTDIQDAMTKLDAIFAARAAAFEVARGRWAE